MPRAFEQPATIALPDHALGEGAALEGLLVPAAEQPDCAGGIVAAPHPLMGGSMDSPVVTELAFALDAAGMSSLRFNWRGVGGSAGAPSGENDDADVDFAASLAFLRDTVRGPLMAMGYSFGAATALRATRTARGLRRLVLVAPPPSLIDASLVQGFDGPILLVSGDSDRFVDVDVLAQWEAARDDVTLEVLEGADHFFMMHLAELRRVIDGWLAGG
jgi:alpha/beta superfamily hydrolase